MREVEAIIDERPAEALSIISEIDSIALTGRAVKAKYSLLQAMALDKNYIDTADTRVVRPAVDWYSSHVPIADLSSIVRKETFIADSPFIYTITESGSGLILFIGVYSGESAADTVD